MPFSDGTLQQFYNCLKTFFPSLFQGNACLLTRCFIVLFRGCDPVFHGYLLWKFRRKTFRIKTHFLICMFTIPPLNIVSFRTKLQKVFSYRYLHPFLTSLFANTTQGGLNIPMPRQVFWILNKRNIKDPSQTALHPFHIHAPHQRPHSDH